MNYRTEYQRVFFFFQITFFHVKWQVRWNGYSPTHYFVDHKVLIIKHAQSIKHDRIHLQTQHNAATLLIGMTMQHVRSHVPVVFPAEYDCLPLD